MSTTEAARWEDTVPRRRVYLVAVVVGLVVAAVALVAASVVLERQRADAADRLNAACQDDQGRAYGAALQVSEPAVDEASATRAASTYVREVRATPVCFSQAVRADAEAVDAALQRGQRPDPQYPKFGD